MIQVLREWAKRRVGVLIDAAVDAIADRVEQRQAAREDPIEVAPVDAWEPSLDERWESLNTLIEDEEGVEFYSYGTHVVAWLVQRDNYDLAARAAALVMEAGGEARVESDHGVSLHMRDTSEDKFEFVCGWDRCLSVPDVQREGQEPYWWSPNAPAGLLDAVGIVEYCDQCPKVEEAEGRWGTFTRCSVTGQKIQDRAICTEKGLTE